METSFAPPERATEDELREGVRIVTESSVLSGLLGAVSGLLAVLNEHRQVVAVNLAVIESLGIADAGAVLGLRLGEMVGCTHAHDGEGGCGTGPACVSCGAAIAIVTSLEKGLPTEMTCSLAVERNGASSDLAFRVHCHPIHFDGWHLLLIFLQDITHQQRLAGLERVFFHDVSNMVMSLVTTARLIEIKGLEADSELVGKLVRQCQRLAQEFSLQRCLVRNAVDACQPTRLPVSVQGVLDEVKELGSRHPSAGEGRTLEVVHPVAASEQLTTDGGILVRVLLNMVVNALEATEADGSVRIWAELAPESVTFCAWNLAEIPRDVVPRVFQRGFSTKGGSGRGLGTFSMRLFGEDFLGGRVSFETGSEQGTTFRLVIPR